MTTQATLFYYLLMAVFLGGALVFVVLPLWKPMHKKRFILISFAFLFCISVLGLYHHYGAKDALNDTYVIEHIESSLKSFGQQSNMTREALIKHLTQLEEDLPLNTPFAWIRMGGLYESFGERDKSRQAFQKAYEATHDEELKEHLHKMVNRG